MSYVIAVIGTIILIAADFITKRLAVTKLMPVGEIPLIEGIFSLYYVENAGAAFGMLQGARWFFVVLTVIIMAGIIYYYIKLPQSRVYTWVRAMLVVIAAGALGNFIDRFRQGYVVDFLYFKAINFAVFNVADIFVVCGTIGLGIIVLFFMKEVK